MSPMRSDIWSSGSSDCARQLGCGRSSLDNYGVQGELSVAGTRQVGGNSEVMSCPMAKKPLPFPERRSAAEPEPLSRSGSRLIFTIADRRFAFEFSSQVTELKPTPARILVLNSDTVKKAPNRAKSAELRDQPKI